MSVITVTYHLIFQEGSTWRDNFLRDETVRINIKLRSSRRMLFWLSSSRSDTSGMSVSFGRYPRSVRSGMQARGIPKPQFGLSVLSMPNHSELISFDWKLER